MTGASPAQQALAAGLADELYIHVAPLLLGDGVRLFDHIGKDIALELIGTIETPEAVHLHYRVLR
jgi:dihydrofolate reductase